MNMDRKMIINEMLLFINIIDELPSLINNNKFSVSTQGDNTIIKKITHHKFTKYIEFTPTNYNSDIYKPNMVDITYIPKNGDCNYKLDNILLNPKHSHILLNYISSNNKIIIKF